MTLNAYAAERRLALLEDLRAGRDPSEGSFDVATLEEGRAKGEPQLGATRFEPDAIWLEFIFPDPQRSATVLTIRLDPPERIVFLPVPEWVVESIWQGDVAGSYQFESRARELVANFVTELEPGANRKWFDPQPPKRRE